MIDVKTMTVLIADDMPNILKAIRSMLRVLGYGKDIVCAYNGKEAWDALTAQDKKIDMAILDWNMPIMKGVEVLERIRYHREMRDMPVIMVSAEANRDIVAQAAESEIDAYLLKPLTVKALNDKILAVVNQANSPSPMTYHLKRAKDFDDEGDIDQAIQETKLAMAANPRSSKPVRELGYLNFKKGDPKEAENWFLKATEMNYLDVMAFHYLGEIYLQRDNIEKAVENFDKAMQISPRHLERGINFGKALVRKGLIDRAAKVFKKTFSLSGDELKLREEIADFCLEQGAMEYAVSLLEYIVDRDMERSDLLFKLGHTLAEMGQKKKAVKFLQQADRKSKDNIEVKMFLAKVFLSLGYRVRAEQSLKQVLKIYPENKEAKELLRKC
jgi:CheY-like chemotaxis protein